MYIKNGILTSMNDIRNQVISLISRIGSLASTYLKNKLKAEGFEGIVSSHGYILHLLTLHKKMTMGEISAAINRDKSTTTVLIKKLEKENFVTKIINAQDSRVRHIMLTAKGIKATTVTADISAELIQTAYTNFTDNEKTELFNLLKKVESNFKSLDKSLI